MVIVATAFSDCVPTEGVTIPDKETAEFLAVTEGGMSRRWHARDLGIGKKTVGDTAMHHRANRRDLVAFADSTSRQCSCRRA